MQGSSRVTQRGSSTVEAIIAIVATGLLSVAYFAFYGSNTTSMIRKLIPEWQDGCAGGAETRGPGCHSPQSER